MKNILIIILLSIGFYFVFAQNDRVFYYHYDKKIYLDKVENTKVIHFNKTIELLRKDSICNILKASNFAVAEITPFAFRILNNFDDVRNTDIISTAIESGDIIYTSDMLLCRDSTLQWASNRLFINIHPVSNIFNILQDSKIPIIGVQQFGSDKQTYLVELDVTELNAIEYANKLSGKENVVWAQPSFRKLTRKFNPYFSWQWGLHNTGQWVDFPGMDINVMNAWNIGATGSGIKVAVIDEGIDLTHPDLVTNLLPGYDATDAYYGGSNGGYGGNGCFIADTHGTACAGIIASEDNDIGVIGVAYHAEIIPVRIAYSTSFYTQHGHCFDLGWYYEDEWIVDGIQWAWQNGADILSNSWGGGEASLAIESEINAAATQGRDSLGCIVVFASGNYNYDSVSFPAELPNVIAVGAISFCGERKSLSSCDGLDWGSNYGQMLDIMAPGIVIPTTDLQGVAGYNSESFQGNPYCDTMVCDFPDKDFTWRFSGTSAAAPHVAGVAALVLSVNPNLTGKQVRDIIESTARKVHADSLYLYSNVPERPNGTWNEEMGYGLVDAHAAVLLAKCYSAIPDLPKFITHNTTWNTPQYVFGDIIIPDDVTLTITSEVKCGADATFIIHPGGTLLLNGATLTNACYGEMWQGITVLGDPTKPLASIYQGYLRMINGSKIENAVCGVTSKNGGYVVAQNSSFENNKTGVKFEPKAAGQTGSAGSFRQTDFILDDSFLGNTADFEAHITAQSSGNVYVAGSNFSSTAPENVAANSRNNGIVTFNTNLSVQGYCRGAVNIYTGCKGPMDTTFFSGFTHAILASNSGASPTFQVQNSAFNHNLRGTTINGIDYHTLIGNNFVLSQHQTFGAHISNATGYKVEENLFKDAQAAPNITTIGLMISNSGVAENEVYKNTYNGLAVGQLFYAVNAFGGNTYSGLQTLCNSFYNGKEYDILSGDSPYMPISPVDHSIKKYQGSLQKPAGNLFYGIPAINIKIQDNPITYYYGAQAQENPPVTTNVNKIQVLTSNSCPSKLIVYRDLNDPLLQYDEWNELYEYWLAQLATMNEDDEEFELIIDKISYYSALKDNYFNGLIVAAMTDEMMRGLGDEMIIGGGEQGSLYEALRFLFNYRGHYADNLSIIETYLAESNYRDAIAALLSIYEQFELSEEQMNELTGLQTYIYWLQQLEETGESIYQLSEREIIYLVNYVETNTGRGRVFANNILCVLYGICIEGGDEIIRGLDDEVIRGLDDEMIRRLDDEMMKKSPSNIEGVDDEVGRDILYEKITLTPNPTTGALRIDNGQLRIDNVEVFDIYGRKLLSNHLITSSSNHLINISHLHPGIYFVKITTEAGMVVKKVVKQ